MSLVVGIIFFLQYRLSVRLLANISITENHAYKMQLRNYCCKIGTEYIFRDIYFSLQTYSVLWKQIYIQQMCLLHLLVYLFAKGMAVQCCMRSSQTHIITMHHSKYETARVHVQWAAANSTALRPLILMIERCKWAAVHVHSTFNVRKIGVHYWWELNGHNM